MSEVAGRMSTQEGARFLEKPQGGRGILLGGVPGVKPVSYTHLLAVAVVLQLLHGVKVEIGGFIACGQTLWRVLAEGGVRLDF